MNRLFLCAFLFLFSIKTNAQHCGMTATDLALLAERHLESKAIQAPDHAIIYVPIFFHLVAKSDGTGAVAENRVLAALCLMNEYYAPVDIQFYIAPHPTTSSLFGRTLQSDMLFFDQSDLSSAVQEFHPNALNVLCVQTAASGSSSGIAFGYYNPSFDVLVMRNDQMNNSSIWLSHEMGHMLSLLHTFHGWEGNPFGTPYPTWPVAPPYIAGIPVELMDGSNCDFAGDMICDTPPDYASGVVTAGCTYNGIAQDPNGVPIMPMVNNLMAYYSGCPDFQFTPMQGERMQADLMTRTNIANSFQGLPTDLDVATDWAIYPSNNDIVPSELTLQWQPVQNASHYIVEVDIIPSFASPFVQRFITTATEAAMQFDVNKSYFWSVTPFNAYWTCTVNDVDLEPVRFYTNEMSDVSNIKGLASLSARLVGGRLIFDAESTENHDLRGILYDAFGREMTSPFRLSLNPGKNHIEHFLENHLPVGVYMLELFGENQQHRAMQLMQH